MTADDIQKVIKLQRALGMAIGALKVIQVSPNNYSRDGLDRVINELEKILKEIQR